MLPSPFSPPPLSWLPLFLSLGPRGGSDTHCHVCARLPLSPFFLPFPSAVFPEARVPVGRALQVDEPSPFFFPPFSPLPISIRLPDQTARKIKIVELLFTLLLPSLHAYISPCLDCGEKKKNPFFSPLSLLTFFKSAKRVKKLWHSPFFFPFFPPIR